MKAVLAVYLIGYIFVFPAATDLPFSKGVALVVLWPVFLIRSIIRGAIELWNE